MNCKQSRGTPVSRKKSPQLDTRINAGVIGRLG